MWKSWSRCSATLKNAGHEVILVSSGAIGMGVGKLSLPARPTDMSTKQACAAVGQCELMYTYDRLFTAYNHTVAQILLTGVDMEHTERRRRTSRTPSPACWSWVPCPSSTRTTPWPPMRSPPLATTIRWPPSSLLRQGRSAGAAERHRRPVHRQPPHPPGSALIPLVEEITPEVMALADGAGSALGTGGMSTKLRAARMVTASGADMVIANGAHPELLYDIAAGKPAGTRFAGTSGGLTHDDTGNSGSRPRGQAGRGAGRQRSPRRGPAAAWQTPLRPAQQEAILAANAEDMAAAKGHISDVMLDRLALTPERIGAMAKGIREVAALPDPVGAVLNRVERPNGLVIEKTAVPMGVIAIIYESRPT